MIAFFCPHRGHIQTATNDKAGTVQLCTASNKPLGVPLLHAKQARMSCRALRLVICLAVFLLLVVPFARGAGPVTFTGKVVGVADGDNIEVMQDGEAVNVRLHGIDCPETGQPFATVAKQFTFDKCFGQEVTIEVTDTDRYGRTVGNVILPNGKNLNHELVRNGLAWWYKQYAPNDVKLHELQVKAMLAEIGLWGESPLVAPWDFRAGKTDLPNYTPPLTDSRSEVKRPLLDSSNSHRLVLKGTGEYNPPASKAEVDARFVPPSDSNDGSGTVYVTRTGSKYHRSNCRHLAQSKIPLSLTDASARGYTPCLVCSPPSAMPTAPGIDASKPTTTYTAPSISIRGPPATADTAGETVYITKTGEKYHRGGCQYLRQSKIPIPKSDAIAQGYGACSRCQP